MIFYHFYSMMKSSPLFEVNIDFDDASKCWLQNKRKLKNGCYCYIVKKDEESEPLQRHRYNTRSQKKEKT